MARTLWAAVFALILCASGGPVRASEPKLVVVLAVDQLSADLFAEYRGRFSGGFARLQRGAVFPSGYQSHASTETCPGHSTILTGARPGRTGIIANMWADPRIARGDKSVYCVEDERIAGTSSTKYVVSPLHLKVPTLGDRLKALAPQSRVVAVSGKDRSAVAMAGAHPDEIWWWRGGQFTSYEGAKMPAAVTAANAAMKKTLGEARPPRALPDVCHVHDVAIPIDAGLTVGQGRLARAADEPLRFQASPDADQAVLDLSLQLVKDMKLGRGAGVDVLAVGLSATDYVGHTYGMQGAEMCIHLLALDRQLETFLKALDGANIDYVVALTADHGGQDVPERSRAHGTAEAHRVDGTLSPARVGGAIAKDLGIAGPVLYAEPYGTGDYWVEPSLPAAQRTEVLTRALAFYRAHPDVEAVFTREEILAAVVPHVPPDEWSLIARVRASYDPERSGDFYVVAKPRVGLYEAASRPYTAGHGTPWDYDRRVPILFWRKGMAGFEQPLAVETVDIMPTLAAMIGMKLPTGEIDGRCLFGCLPP